MIISQEPGPAQTRDHRVTLSPLLVQAFPIVAARAAGCELWDRDGRRFLDLTAGIGVLATGHSHPAVVRAVQRQAELLTHAQYGTLLHVPLIELLDGLGSVLPVELDAVFFTSTGTEAVEAALRLARQATGRPTVVAFRGSFHGRTMGSASLTTSRAVYRAGWQPLMGGVAVAPFPYAFRYGWSEEETVAFCLRELDHLLATEVAPADLAAVIVEPVLGEGGYVPAPPAFLRGLRERCDAAGALLVLDEIQCGYGRTGRFWAHERAGIGADVLVMGKAIASGLPLAGIAASRALLERGSPGSQGGTYGANALACAAAVATLRVYEEERLVERAGVLGDRLLGGLRSVAGDVARIGDVRGVGLMAAVEMTDEHGRPDAAFARAVQERAAELGLLVLTCGSGQNVIRWVPPLVVTPEQLDEGLEIFRAAALNVARTGS